MKTFFIILFLSLISCQTTQSTPSKPISLTLRDHIRIIYVTHYRNTYETNMNACFIMLNQCKLAGKQGCWPKHEKCIISATQQFKFVMESFKNRWPKELPNLK